MKQNGELFDVEELSGYHNAVFSGVERARAAKRQNRHERERRRKHA